MIEVKNKENCCGCEACANICPKHCITMVEDEEGFRYPQVDKEKCINCRLCEKVCPIINEVKKSDILNQLQFYASYNKNDEILKNSSSGGMFTLFAECILKKNGVVYGVIQENTYDVKFVRAENEKDLEKMRGSKYLQAHVNNIYNRVLQDLKEERYVLFSGTPCQIAALYNVLGKNNYEKLYTIDVVCHGVPSNAVYQKYITYLEYKFNKKVTFIKWRDKINGWGPNRITLYFNDDSKYTTVSRENPFQTGFLDNIYLRPSCYKCIYAKLPRIGDISLADFWGYDGKLLGDNQNKGLSAVIISSKKGNEFWEAIKKDLVVEKVDEQYLKERCRHAYIHPVLNKNREKFFEDFKNMKFNKLARKYNMEKPLIIKILKKAKTKIKRITKGSLSK